MHDIHAIYFFITFKAYLYLDFDIIFSYLSLFIDGFLKVIQYSNTSRYSPLIILPVGEADHF